MLAPVSRVTATGHGTAARPVKTTAANGGYVNGSPPSRNWYRRLPSCRTAAPPIR
jgi:hypothetical protein